MNSGLSCDAADHLVAELQRSLPDATVRCEAVETSTFFGRRFDAAIAIGLVLLLPADMQRQTMLRVAAAVYPGERLLFTAPTQDTVWHDRLTGRQSRSFGRAAYEAILREAGLDLVDEFTDEGENHYYSAKKPL